MRARRCPSCYGVSMRPRSRVERVPQRRSIHLRCRPEYSITPSRDPLHILCKFVVERRNYRDDTSAFPAMLHNSEFERFASQRTPSRHSTHASRTRKTRGGSLSQGCALSPRDVLTGLAIAAHTPLRLLGRLG